MKVAILGDFHFGYPRFYEDSFIQAERALLKADEQADVLLIAGDIFDTRVPKPEVISRAIEIFKKLKHKPIVIHGTHERRPKGFVNPVELLCQVGLAENAHGKNVIREIDGEKIAVYGLGGVPEEYAKAAIGALNPQPVEGAFNVFMFHQNLKELMEMVEHGLYMDDLPPGFDLYIDGHLHKHNHLEKGGKFLIIPGSTVMTQIRKEESKKGFVLYDTTSRGFEFIEIQVRPFYYILAHSSDEAISKIASIDLNPHPIVALEVHFKPDELFKSRLRAYEEHCYLFLNYKADDESSAVEWGASSLLESQSLKEMGVKALNKSLSRKGLKGGDLNALLDLAEEGDVDRFISVFREEVKEVSD